MEENFLNKRPENSAVEIDDDAAVHKLRLLAVDAQIFSLQYLSVVLHKCNYKVKATTSAAEALEILGANKNEFDVVLVDVDSANIKGFKLLEIIGLEMYIPVIMVTGDGSLENIIKGLNYGAVDYIIKPVGVQEIKDAIWHCVAPNNTDWGSQQSTDTHESSDHQNVKPSEHSDASFTVEDDKHNTPLDDASSSCQRKKRMVWTPELDAKFVRAVQTLSKGSMVHPKRILEIMKEPGLTRAKVASHLQKYRMSLKKQQSFDIESVTRFSSTKRTNRRYGKAGDVNADPVAVPSFNPFNSLEDIMLVDPEKPYQSVPYSCLDDLNFQTPDFKSFNYYNYCLGMNIQPHNLGSEPLPGITSRPPYFHDVGSEASSPSSAPFYPSSNAFLAPETDVPFQSSFAVASVPNRFPGGVPNYGGFIVDFTNNVQYPGSTGLTSNIGETELVSNGTTKSQTDIRFHHSL